MTQDPVYSNHYTADEGKVLANNAGVYSKEIWLGVRDSIDNWEEINEEEVEDACHFSY